MRKELTPLSEEELESLDHLTAEELVATALAHGMIDEGEPRGERIFVRIARESFDLSREQAAFFLVAVIRASQRLLGFE